MNPRLPPLYRSKRRFITGGLILLASAHALLGGAFARPLTNPEVQTLRAAPPFGQSDKVPDGLARLQAAMQLAHRLGMEGNADAVPLLVELRQTQLLNSFAGSYSGQATPALEALALQHLKDPVIAPRLLVLLKKSRSPEIFDAMMRALPEGKIDCHILLGVAADAQVPDVEPRLARQLPTLHPAFGRHIAQRFAESDYFAGADALVDLLRRTRLDTFSTVLSLADAMVRLESDVVLDAIARKLIEVAAAPEDKTVKFGLIFSIRNEDIPKDGLLCSTQDLRIPHPLMDARSKQVKSLLNNLKFGLPGAVLDRSLFGPKAMSLFSPAEQKAVNDMLEYRTQVEAKARDLTPENLIHWIQNSIKPTMVRRFIERGIDVNRPTGLGERPLVFAARTLHATPIEMLLAAGADPNLTDLAPQRELNTALIAMSNHQGRDTLPITAGVRIMKALIAKKADVRARNRDGATALHMAASQHPELARLLLDAGAEVKVADKDGATPLHRAVQGRQMALARELLDRGADVNAEEMGGVTPLLLARDNDDREMSSLIASRGGRINQAYFLKREAIRLIYTRPGGGH